MSNKQKVSISHFGRAGWGIILYCMLMFWFHIGMVNDGANYTAPAVAVKLGIDRGLVLTMNTVAGLIGIILFILFAQMNRKLGARKTSALLLILAAVGYTIVGQSLSLTMYTVGMCMVVSGSMSAGYIAGGALVAQWFPKKKGIVMGYTTMGHNLASAFYVPLIGWLINSFGVGNGTLCITIATAVLGVMGLLFIRNTPQERGQYPDNVPAEVYNAEYETEIEDESGGWTTKKLLKTREVWLCGITTGLFQICSAGVMTQLVSRNIELGFSEGRAVSTMTVRALVGVFGSWLIGVFDSRFGTKRSMVGFAIWYAAALLLNATEIMPLVYLSLFMIAIGIGGSANFTTSLPTSVFGRHGFSKVNSVIFPIQGALTCMSGLVNGTVLLLTGGLRMSYLFLACVAIFNIFLICNVKDGRYNRDIQAEKAHEL
ncbi:MAG: MFS transporter [Oscillospiraceae bacterium]|nr:MFS transporter [Oscillospiraceae bacterium]